MRARKFNIYNNIYIPPPPNTEPGVSKIRLCILPKLENLQKVTKSQSQADHEQTASGSKGQGNRGSAGGPPRHATKGKGAGGQRAQEDTTTRHEGRHDEGRREAAK